MFNISTFDISWICFSIGTLELGVDIKFGALILSWIAWMFIKNINSKCERAPSIKDYCFFKTSIKYCPSMVFNYFKTSSHWKLVLSKSCWLNVVFNSFNTSCNQSFSVSSWNVQFGNFILYLAYKLFQTTLGINWVTFFCPCYSAQNEGFI